MAEISSDLKLDFKETKELVKHCVLAKKPIMIWGPPGIGKSDMIRAAAKDLGWNVIDLRLALLESVDIKGYPYLSEIEVDTQDLDPDTGEVITKKGMEKVLSFAMNKEFPRNPDQPTILFFDEINAAQQSTQLAMYQLILDRQIGEYTLPDCVSMVAAGNREADRGGINSMPKPLENRFFHVEMYATFATWVEFALAKGYHPDIIGFLAKNEQKLNAFDPRSSSRAFPTPRSWANVSDMYSANIDAPERLLENIMSAGIGGPVTSEFMAFRKIAHDLPSADEILSGKAPALKKKSVDITYMLLTNCLYKLRELQQSETKTKGSAASDDMCEKTNHFIEYLMNNKNIDPDFQILALSLLYTTYGIKVDLARVPAMRKLCEKNLNLLEVLLGS